MKFNKSIFTGEVKSWLKANESKANSFQQYLCHRALRVRDFPTAQWAYEVMTEHDIELDADKKWMPVDVTGGHVVNTSDFTFDALREAAIVMRWMGYAVFEVPDSVEDGATFSGSYDDNAMEGSTWQECDSFELYGCNKDGEVVFHKAEDRCPESALLSAEQVSALHDMCRDSEILRAWCKHDDSWVDQWDFIEL